MKIQTQPYAGQLVLVTCCTCGVPFGLDRRHWEDRQGDGKSFYCPNGHSQYFTRREKLEKELRNAQHEIKLAKEDVAYWQDEANAQAKSATLAKRRTAAAKGQLTKLRNKVAAGECPCCHQHFPDVRDHIAAEHPDFLNDEEDTAAEQ